MSAPDLVTIETIDPITDEVTDTEKGKSAHIVKVAPGEDASAKVVEARVMGTPLEALCGYVWVPSKDPKKLPVCEQCKEIYDMHRIFNDGLNDSPNQ